MSGISEENILAVVAALDESERKLAVCVRALKEISLNQCTAMAWDMTKAPTIGTSVCSHHLAKQALSEIGEK